MIPRYLMLIVNATTLSALWHLYCLGSRWCAKPCSVCDCCEGAPAYLASGRSDCVATVLANMNTCSWQACYCTGTVCGLCGQRPASQSHAHQGSFRLVHRYAEKGYPGQTPCFPARTLLPTPPQAAAPSPQAPQYILSRCSRIALSSAAGLLLLLSSTLLTSNSQLTCALTCEQSCCRI